MRRLSRLAPLIVVVAALNSPILPAQQPLIVRGHVVRADDVVEPGRGPVDRVFQFGILELRHLAAAIADQVVVVLATRVRGLVARRPVAHLEPPDEAEPHFHLTLRVTDEWGRIVFEGESSTSTMRRSFTELLEWLLIDNPVPPGSVLLTGTGLVPPDSFTLLPGHFVEIHVPEIGTLVNPVVRASELIEKEPIQ